LDVKIKLYSKKQQYQKLESALDEKIKLATAEQNAETLGKAYLKLGKLAIQKKGYRAARTYLLKSATADPKLAKEVYSILGNLYLSSFEKCLPTEGNAIKDKAVYFAAYEMFKKAGDQAGMKKARAQFPTMASIHQNGYKEGASISVGCWVGGSYPILRR